MRLWHDIKLALAGAVLASAVGCEALAPHARNESGDPDERLRIELDMLERARARGPNNDVLIEQQQVIVDSGDISNNILRLSLEFPYHVPTLLANAMLSYEQRESTTAEAFLDRVLRIEPMNADAGELRGRMALEEGNVPFALKTLKRHVDGTPDVSTLRETYAAALLYAGDFAEAEVQLDAAERLGSPLWRVRYHRGLVAERRGDAQAARASYESALADDPDFAAARSRLAGLDVRERR
jgi:predicted Zn-dependent protease